MSASASATPMRSPWLAASASSPTSSWISANRRATCSAPTSMVGSSRNGNPYARWKSPTWVADRLGCARTPGSPAKGAGLVGSPSPPGIAWSGTVDTHQLAAGVGREPAAVLHQETHRAGEFVGLLRDDLDGQLLAGEVGPRQLETFRGVAFVDVDNRGLSLVPTGLQFLERILGRLVGLITARCVVIGSHCLFLTSSSSTRLRRH